jgi:hypothetical protein
VTGSGLPTLLFFLAVFGSLAYAARVHSRANPLDQSDRRFAREHRVDSWTMRELRMVDERDWSE